MYDDSHLVTSAPLIISKIEPVETADRLRHKCLEVCVDRERERGAEGQGITYFGI